MCSKAEGRREKTKLLVGQGNHCEDTAFVWLWLYYHWDPSWDVWEEISVGGRNVMKMGVTTQLASQAKLSKNTSCVGYSTTKVMNSEWNGSVSYWDTFTHWRCSLASSIVLAWHINSVLFPCLGVKQWLLQWLWICCVFGKDGYCTEERLFIFFYDMRWLAACMRSLCTKLGSLNNGNINVMSHLPHFFLHPTHIMFGESQRMPSTHIMSRQLFNLFADTECCGHSYQEYDEFLLGKSHLSACHWCYAFYSIIIKFPPIVCPCRQKKKKKNRYCKYLCYCQNALMRSYFPMLIEGSLIFLTCSLCILAYPLQGFWLPVEHRAPHLALS